MSTRSRSPERTAQAGDDHAPARNASEVGQNGAAAGAPWHLAEELGRQQLAAATEAAAVLFRSAEAIRRIQQQAAHHASVRHQEAMQQLQASSDTFQLLAVPSQLLRFDMEEAFCYWQALGQNAVQTQVEMVGCVNTLFSRAGANGSHAVSVGPQARVTRPAQPGSAKGD